MTIQQTEAETETTPTRGLIFTPDTETNNRLKVARLAREMRGNEGVIDATVGTLTIVRGPQSKDEWREVIEVTYHQGQAVAAQAAINVPIAITRAYFDRDEGDIAAEFVTTTQEESEPREIFTGHWQGVFLINKTPVVIGDVTYQSDDIKEMVGKLLPYDMNQIGKAKRELADISHAHVVRQEHEAKIQEAHQNKNKEHHWRAHRALSQECTLDLDDKQACIDHRKLVGDATHTLTDAYTAELLAICHRTLGKLRCESDLGRNGDGDPYGFTTTSEVAAYILTRWVDEETRTVNHAIRKVMADEFVRHYLR